MKRQSGITLIEVLIAVLVLSIGLLGIAGMQASALTSNSTSYQYTMASMLVESMAERMRANSTGAMQLNYSMSPGMDPTTTSTASISNSKCGVAGAGCSTSAQALWDEAMFYSQVTGAAVSGSGTGSGYPPVLGTSYASGGSGTSGACGSGSYSGGTTTVSGLPCGAASISCLQFGSGNHDVTTQCVITVYWDPGRTGATDYTCNTSSALRCFSLSLAFQQQS